MVEAGKSLNGVEGRVEGPSYRKGLNPKVKPSPSSGLRQKVGATKNRLAQVRAEE